MGVGGSDTIYYFTLAEYWLRGDPVFRIGEGVQVLRPVLLAFNTFALWLFGHTDYAIKLAYVLLDTVNLLLLAALAWRMGGRVPVVMGSAAAYALLPLAAWASRQELPHTVSTTCVLAALYLLQRGLAAGSSRALALAGLCLGAAALTHEELVLLAPPLAIAVGVGARARNAGALRDLAAFLGLPALAALALVATQPEEILPRLGANFLPGGFYPEVFGRFLWNVVAGSLSVVAALLALCALVMLLWRSWRERPVSPAVAWGLFCLLVPAAFVALYALFFSTIFPRGFLPLVPLLVIGMFLGADSLRLQGALATTTLISALVALLVVSNLASYSAFAVGNRRYSSTWAQPVWPGPQNLRLGYREFLQDARYVPGYASHWRAVHDAVPGPVDAANRLLILPSTAMYSPGRRPLQNRVYFGDDAIYRIDHPELSLAELVQQYNIRWVLFTTGQRRGEPSALRRYLYNGRWAPREPVDLAAAYSMPRYSAQAEYGQLLRYLASVGARELDVFPAGSFESQVARLWRL